MKKRPDACTRKSNNKIRAKINLYELKEFAQGSESYNGKEAIKCFRRVKREGTN